MIKEYYDIAFAALDGSFGDFYEIVAVLSFVFFFNFLIGWALKLLHARYLQQRKIWKDSFVQAVLLPLTCIVWFFALVHVSNLLMMKFFSEHFIPDLHTLRVMTFIVGLGWFFLRWKRLLVKLTLQKSKNHEIAMDQGKISVLDKLATLVILFIFSLLMLEISGGNMNTLIAFGGVGGLAIAIASQEIIGNFFGGLMIYLTKPFTIGDWINLPEKSIEGYVEEIGWYMTRVRTFEKRPIYIPNSIFTKVVVMTPSRMSHRQFIETISLKITSASKVKGVVNDIKEMLLGHLEVDQTQTTLVYLKTFANNCLDIYVSAYVRTIDHAEYGKVKQSILLSIINILNEQGAELNSLTPIIQIYDGMQLTHTINPPEHLWKPQPIGNPLMANK